MSNSVTTSHSRSHSFAAGSDPTTYLSSEIGTHSGAAQTGSNWPMAVFPTVSSSTLTYNAIGAAIELYVTPCVFLVGLVGNTLSMMVMMQPLNRRISCCVYMAALAFMDNLTILSAGAVYVASLVPGEVLSDLACQTIVMLGQTFLFCGVLLVVCMTADRWVAVQFPLQAAVWCSTRRAKLTTIFITLFSLAYNIPYFLYARRTPNGKHCHALAVKNRFTSIYMWVSVALNSLVPFTALLVFNSLIIRAVRSRQKFFAADKDKSETTTDQKEKQSKLEEKQENTAGSKESDSRMRQLSLMLLLVSFALLFLTLPQYIRYVVFALVDLRSNSEAFAIYAMLSNISRTFFFANNSLNFFLYCLGGSKFRQDVAKIVCCQK